MANFYYPVQAAYKQNDHDPKDTVSVGDWYRTNWLDNDYSFGPNKSEAFHTGDDIVIMGGNCKGQPVYAIFDGLVRFAQDVTGTTWRNLVDIEHELPEGVHVTSRYAHLNTMLVKKGDKVKAGQQIGTVGDAFGVLAPHLHFDLCDTDLLKGDPTEWPGMAESKVLENYIDPKRFLDANKAGVVAPPPPPVTETLYVIATDGVNLRSAASTSSTILYKNVPFRSVVIASDAQTVKGVVWRQVSVPSLGKSGWMASGDGKAEAWLSAAAPVAPAAMWGVNIDPSNSAANPAQVDCPWVRFVFKSAGKPLANAFAIYDNVIAKHRAAGTSVLLILNQETNNTEDLHLSARDIAKHYAGQVAAYEIWNEEDQASASAVGLPPEVFGRILAGCAAAIHAADDAAKVIIGGLVGGDPIAYLKASGTIGADGIGLHPYTKSVQQIVDYLAAVHAAFPALSLWITEYSLQGSDASVAAYMHDSFAAVSKLSYVAALIWFCWSDSMVDTFGIYDKAGHTKPLAFAAYLANCGKIAPPSVEAPVIGYDISHYNPVDAYALGKIADFIFHKSSEGNYMTDATYEPHRKSAISGNANILWGGYHFGTTDNINAQINRFMASVNLDNTKPILDLERGMTLAQAAEWATIIYGLTGAWPLVYTRKSYIDQQNDSAALAVLANCDLWLASSDANPAVPKPWKRWTFQQYAVTQPAGQPVSVDTNRFNGSHADFDAWKRSAKGHGVTNWTPLPEDGTTHTAKVSKIGLHIMNGVDSNALIDLLRSTNSAGKPIPGVLLMKQGWGGEFNVSGIKGASPKTEVMLRYWKAENEDANGRIPWHQSDLREIGRSRVLNYAAYLNDDDKLADFHQFINEPSAGIGTPSFWDGAISAANDLGIKIAIGCFSVGTPALPGQPGGEFWADMGAVMEKAVKGGHCYMRHNYTVPDPGGDWVNEWTMTRHHKDIESIGIPGLAVRLGEFGTEYGLTIGGDLYKRLAEADAAMSGDTCLWAALWSLGNGGSSGWDHSRLDWAIPLIKSYLLQYGS